MVFKQISFLNKYRSCLLKENRLLIVKARSKYKSTITSCKKRFVDDRTKTLEQYRHNNAKLYWKMLKQSTHIKSPDIPLSSFEVYFKGVNNSEDPFFQADEDIMYYNERFERDEFQVMFHELDADITIAEIKKGI